MESDQLTVDSSRLSENSTDNREPTTENLPEPPPVPAEKTALDVMTDQVQSLTKQLQALTSERDEYRDTLADVAAERDTLKGSPDQAARIAELEGTIRDRTHFDKFAELAKGAKAKDAALKHLWQVSGYKAEADEIDEPGLKTLVGELRKNAAYAFDEDEPANVQGRPGCSPTPDVPDQVRSELRGEEAAGGGRHERNQGADGTIVTQEMRADPRFMLDPKNRELIKDAAIGGRFR